MPAPKNNKKEAKPRPSLLPMDLLMEMMCPAYEEGVVKYYRESWREGFYFSDMFDACIRHICAFYYDKEDYDQESLEKYGIKKHHLGAALFCIISMYNSWKNHPELDDRGLNVEELNKYLQWEAEKESVIDESEEDCGETDS